MPTDEDLFLAIADNNLKKVKCLIGIEEGLSYTGAYDYGTPLFHSVESGYSRIVQYLLDNKYCFIDEGDESSSYSPLMLACEKGDIAIAEMLIAYGADVNKQYEKEDEQGYSLTLAAENGFIEIVELLLTHKADPESIKWYYDGECNFRYTPILLALIQDNQKMVELILRNGADVDGECAINCELHTPLSYAVAKNLPLWVHFFLQHGANPEKTLGDSYTVKDYAKELGRQDFLIQ